MTMLVGLHYGVPITEAYPIKETKKMPTASDERRAQMAKWFPTGRDGCINRSGTDDGAPTRFLLTRGWTEAAGMWSKPTPSYNPSYYEVQCLLFLRDEWDYDFHKPLFQEA